MKKALAAATLGVALCGAPALAQNEWGSTAPPEWRQQYGYDRYCWVLEYLDDVGNWRKYGSANPYVYTGRQAATLWGYPGEASVDVEGKPVLKDRTGKLRLARAPCPPPSTASSGLPTGGGTYAVGGWSYGLSGALTYPHTNFIDRGSASGSAGAVCADVSKDIWGSGLRYAGEFSGFRIAATASACQGFGTATQFVPLGGFDGKTSIGTFFTAGGRLEIPLNLNGLRIIPFAGVGGAYAHVKVEAFPFESNSSWRSGTYWEAGAAVPVPPKFFGMGTVQGIDAVSAEVYASWKRIGVGHQTLDGGAPTKTDLDMIMGGARIKY